MARGTDRSTASTELQRFQRELPADSYTRTAASHPSVVHVRLPLRAERIFVRVPRARERLGRTSNDVTVDRQRVWNRNIAGQNVANRFRDDGLAVSWRPCTRSAMRRWRGRVGRVNRSLSTRCENAVESSPASRSSGDRARSDAYARDTVQKRNRYVADVLAVLEHQAWRVHAPPRSIDSGRTPHLRRRRQQSHNDARV